MVARSIEYFIIKTIVMSESYGLFYKNRPEFDDLLYYCPKVMGYFIKTIRNSMIYSIIQCYRAISINFFGVLDFYSV